MLDISYAILYNLSRLIKEGGDHGSSRSGLGNLCSSGSYLRECALHSSHLGDNCTLRLLVGEGLTEQSHKIRLPGPFPEHLPDRRKQ